MNKQYLEAYLYTPGCLNIVANFFPLCSRRAKSVPGAGSPCYKTMQIKQENLPKATRYIEHKNGDITGIFPGIGYIRFWKDRH